MFQNGVRPIPFPGKMLCRGNLRLVKIESGILFYAGKADAEINLCMDTDDFLRQCSNGLSES